MHELTDKLMRKDFCIAYMGDKTLRVKIQGATLINQKYWFDHSEQYYKIKIIIGVDKYQVDNAEILEQ